MDLDFAPDYSLYTPGMIQTLFDFFPRVNGGYQTACGPYQEGYSSPTTVDVIGSAIVKNKSGNVLLYAGTQTKLYQANGSTGWTDRSGKAYSTASTGTWEFVQYGDTTIAANGADTLQQSTGGAFSDVATAPIAKIIIPHENAIIALNLSTDSAGWARSDTGSLTFTVTAANDADNGTFLEGSGPVTAGARFNTLAIAWKGDWMYQGRFTGDIDQKVRWDTVAPGVGCVGQHAHIETDIGIIFVSNRDILLFDGTSQPKSIADKVRKAFLKELNPSQRANILLTHNEIERNVYVWIPTGANTYCTKAWIYNYKTGKWGHRDTIDTSPPNGYTYIRTRVVGANVYPDYQLVGGIGSNAGLEANVVWASLSGGARLVNFANTAAKASGSQSNMVLGLYGDPNVDQRLVGARMIYESTPANPLLTTTVTSYTPTLSTGSQTFGSIDPDGNVNFNAEARFHQMGFTWTANQTSGSLLKTIIPRWYGQGGDR